MSELQEYLARLDRQRPDVQRIREDARARGDLATARNAERLLEEWAAVIAKFTPANDIKAGAITAVSLATTVWRPLI